MKVYTVHEPGDGVSSDRVDRAERFEFVSDGFDWNAALFAPFVLLANRIYVGLALYSAALVALVASFSALGADAGWIVLVIAALHVFVGFEYGELKRAKLDGAGWSDLGPVSGRSLAECERRFYEAWLPGQPLMTGLRTIASAAPQSSDLPGVAGPKPQSTSTRPDSTRPNSTRPASTRSGWRVGLPWKR